MSNAREAVSRTENAKEDKKTAPWEKRVTKFNRRKMAGMGKSNDGKTIPSFKSSTRKSTGKRGTTKRA